MNKIIHLFRKRRNGGFTLVEMIVACAVLSVLMVGMIITISPIVQSYNDTSTNLVAENVATCVQNYITMSTRNATSVLIFGNTNEESIKNNANDKINALKTFCKTKTGSGRDAYVLKCISLKYDSTDGRYYLYTETIDPTQTGDSANPFDNKGTRRSVFSKCFYDDVYYSMSFGKASNMDPATKGTQPTLPATLETTVMTFSDSSCNNRTFSGIGLTEYREILRDKERNKTKAKYKFEIYNGTAPSNVDSVTTSGATDDSSRDVFIFYTVYNYDSSKDT